MDDPAREDLLWELAEMERRGAALNLSEPELQAYRRGGMSEAESDRVEGILIENSSERRRLERIAGVRLEAPASVRARLFGEMQQRVSGRRRVPWRTAAAAAIAGFALLCGWQMKEHGLLPGSPSVTSTASLPDYRVEISGMASVRSAASGSTALPGTIVDIAILPHTGTSTTVDFGLYRRVDAGLVRVLASDILEVRQNRGAISLRIAARNLVGDAAGVHSFYIVLSQSGGLPDELKLPPDVAVSEALQKAIDGKVYEQTLTIVEQAPNTQTPE